MGEAPEVLPQQRLLRVRLYTGMPNAAMSARMLWPAAHRADPTSVRAL
jgi:hypothetical protein